MAKNCDEMPHDYEGGRVEAKHSIDDFLGGRIKLKQPISGYRVSMDTVLLAASVPAQCGDTILEAGTGTGGAALCLAHRVGAVLVTGLELQHEMADFARENVLLNDKIGRAHV